MAQQTNLPATQRARVHRAVADGPRAGLGVQMNVVGTQHRLVNVRGPIVFCVGRAGVASQSARLCDPRGDAVEMPIAVAV